MLTYELLNDTLRIKLDGVAESHVLHFGLGTNDNPVWTAPPSTITGAAISTGFGEIPFSTDGELSINVSEIYPQFRYFYFVLHRLRDNAWLKAPGGDNYTIDLQSELQLAEKIPTDSANVSVFRYLPNVLSFATADLEELQLTIYVKSDRNVKLHWGIPTTADASTWANFDRSIIRDTENVLELGNDFCRVQMTQSDIPGWRKATIAIHPPEDSHTSIAFLYYDEMNNWYKNANHPSGNFVTKLPSHESWEANRALLREKKEAKAKALLAAEMAKKVEEERKALFWEGALNQFQANAEIGAESGKVTFREVHRLKGGEDGAIQINVEQSIPVVTDTFDESSDDGTASEGDRHVPEIPADSLFFVVTLRACLKRPLHIHWGAVGDGSEACRNLRDWKLPQQPMLDLPEGTEKFDERAVQTPLKEVGDSGFLYEFHVRVPATYSTPYLTPKGISGLAFVLVDRERNEWYKESGGDFVATLRPITVKHKLGPVADQIFEAEVLWSSITLMHRYNLCADLIRKQLGSSSKDKAQNTDFWSWMYVWNRFNQLGWLTWQKNYNTKPKDMAHACEQLSILIGEAWKQEPSCRKWAAMIIPTIGRGGSGQAVRDVILEIMHRHKIPETSGQFYEQWHQKLHNNTTPDDVGICKALIKYLQTGGNMHEYWSVLRAHRIDRERLAGYERPIVHEPYWPHCDINGLLHDLGNYLNILVDIHDAADVERAASRMHYAFSDDIRHLTNQVLGTIKDSRDIDLTHAAENMIRIAAVRSATARLAANPHNCAARDAITLNSVLEVSQSIVLQRATKGSQINLGTAVEAVIALVTNWVENEPCNEEWKAILEDWQTLGRDAARHQVVKNDPIQNALVLKALLDRLTRAVGEMTDEFQTLLGPRALFLGEQLNLPKGQLDVFVDEVVRGSSLFCISKIVKAMEPEIRKQAKLPPWQLISPVAKVTGRLLVIKELRSFQESVFNEPTIMISGAVNGEEDIPEGVVGVLVRSSEAAPDILSHCAVRARNANVLLAVCFEPEVVAVMEREADKWVSLEICQGGAKIVMTPAQQPSLSTEEEMKPSDTTEQATTGLMNLTAKSSSYIVTAADFSSEHVGSKSFNLVRLTEQLGKLVETPSGVALPYGCFQKCLSEETAQLIGRHLASIMKRPGDFRRAERLLKKIRSLVLAMPIPDDLYLELEAKSTTDSTKIVNKIPPREDCERAIREVWASLFGIRPYVALHKAMRNFQDLSMAVLCQPLIKAQYAFVLHTQNPFAEDTMDELYGEIVEGLGETLVGNYPGRALSWTMKRNATLPSVIAFPSKSTMLVPVESMIFRSDSNGEDLEGFAGAGLFESIPTAAPIARPCVHSKHTLVVNQEERTRILASITKLAFSIEDAFEQPMDIEGVVEAETKKIVIVQARPQV